MNTKLTLAASICLLVGCGLNTEGQGYSDTGDDRPDVSLDEAEPDIFEADSEDVTEPDIPDVVEAEALDEATEETEVDVTADEAGDEIGSETETDTEEDGEIADPCAPPDIPTTGLYVFYCFTDEITADMTLWRQVLRAGRLIVDWSESPGCTATGARSLFCELTLYYNATYFFNIQIPGIGIGWSCGPDLVETWGHPRVWLNGYELTVTPIANVDGGCNHSFGTPSPP